MEENKSLSSRGLPNQKDSMLPKGAPWDAPCLLTSLTLFPAPPDRFRSFIHSRLHSFIQHSLSPSGGFCSEQGQGASNGESLGRKGQERNKSISDGDKGA